MKRALRLGAVFVLAFAALSAPVYALVKSDDTIIIKADQVLNDDLFAAGDEVIIEGTINGDVYVGANRLSVRGTVNGDVIAGANSIEVSGSISDDLRVAGNTISLIGATIGDSVTVAGNELSIDSSTKIGGGLQFGGRLLSLDGSVGRGIMSGNQTTRINAPVGRTVRVASDNIKIGESAIIKGNLEYSSNSEATIDGEVLGEVVHKEGVNVDSEEFMRSFVVAFNIWAYGSALLIAGIMTLLFPRLFRRAHERFMKKPWPMTGWGALALFAGIPIAVIMTITVFGIPLAVLWVLAWVLAIIFAKFFVGYTVGYSILKWLKDNKQDHAPKTFWALVLGLTLYYLLRQLPIIGIFVRLATTIVGLGIILSLYSRKSTKVEE